MLKKHFISQLVVFSCFTLCFSASPSSCTLNSSSIRTSPPYKTIGVTGKKKLPADYQPIADNFYSQLMEQLSEYGRGIEAKQITVPDEKLTQLVDLKDLRTYLPRDANLSDSGWRPDIIIFIKRFSALESLSGSGGPKPEKDTAATVSASAVSIEFAVVFWDNSAARVVGYRTITEKTAPGADAGRAKRTAEKLAEGVMQCFGEMTGGKVQGK